MLLKQAADLRDEVQAATRVLAGSTTVPAGVTAAIHRVADALTARTPSDDEQVDPYLLASLMQGVISALRVEDRRDDDPLVARRHMRVALEQVRVALRDIAERQHVSPAVDAKELATWVDRVLDSVSDEDKAGLVGVSRRTWQRWTSPDDGAPSGEDLDRLRSVARATAHLRYSFTPAGVLGWLRRPHPMLGGQPPLNLLMDPVRAPDAIAAAAATRANYAA